MLLFSLLHVRYILRTRKHKLARVRPYTKAKLYPKAFSNLLKKIDTFIYNKYPWKPTSFKSDLG